MNDERKLAVLRAGIVPVTTVNELARWGMQVPETVPVVEDRKEVLAGIREAIESRKTVAIRQTDLDALNIYAEDPKEGRLYYTVPDSSKPGARKTTFVDVTYAVTPAGDYLIPWTDEDIFDLMLDPGTYLKPAGDPRVYFAEISELYYGEEKAFMSCRPAAAEEKS